MIQSKWGERERDRDWSSISQKVTE